MKTLQGDEKIGAQIVRRAIEEPLRQIVGNAGEEGAVVGKILQNKDPNFGYNASTNQYEDPGQGRRHRPHQGSPHCPAQRRFVAGLMLTTEAMVSEIPRRNRNFTE